MQRPNYGIDAPGLVRFFFAAGVAAVALYFVSEQSTVASPPLMSAASALASVAAVYLLGMGCFMVYYSRVEKLRDRDRLLDLLSWSGTERVLDVGCGRGLLLVGAAKRLTTGRAIGIDLWRQTDQASNNEAAARGNAALEQVLDRVDVQTADMLRLPFTADEFDVVVSNWTVHNLDAVDDRKAALGEMVRVLKPGGKILLNDIVHQSEYAKHLGHLGLEDLRCHNNALRDAVLKAITFGSFAPAEITDRKAL